MQRWGCRAASLLRPQGNEGHVPVLDPPCLEEGKWDQPAGLLQPPLASPPSTFFNHSLACVTYLTACLCAVASVMSDSLRPRGLQSARLLCPWGFSRHWASANGPCLYQANSTHHQTSALKSSFLRKPFLKQPQGHFGVSLAFPRLLPQKILACVWLYPDQPWAS